MKRFVRLVCVLACVVLLLTGCTQESGKANLYLVFSDHEGTLFSIAEQLRQAGIADDDRCITAISCIHADFQDAPTAYLEAAAAYENRFVMGNQKVLQYNDISSNLLATGMCWTRGLMNCCAGCVIICSAGITDQKRFILPEKRMRSARWYITWRSISAILRFP